MQTSKISNQTSFNGICINTSKMGKKQEALARNLLSSTIGHMQWDDITQKGIDVFVLTHGKNGIKARFLDTRSGEYFKDKFNKFIETHIEGYSNLVNRSDEIIGKICDLANPQKTKQPKLDRNAIFEGKTTLFKIRPALHEEMTKDYKKFLAEGLVHSDAKDQAIEMHLMFIPEDGYNFNF